MADELPPQIPTLSSPAALYSDEEQETIPDSGSLKQTPCVVLLRRAMTSNASGRLEMFHDVARRQVVFVGGLPVDVRSNLLPETLPRFLMTRHMIDKALYTELMQLDPRSDQALALLTQSSQLTAQQLRDAYEELASELLQACFTWSVASFTFTPKPPHRLLKRRVHLDPVLLVAQWAQEWRDDAQVEHALQPLAGCRLKLTVAGYKHRSLIEEHTQRAPALAKLFQTSTRLDAILGSSTANAFLYAVLQLGLVRTSSRPANVASFDILPSVDSVNAEHEPVGDFLAATPTAQVHRHFRRLVEHEWDRLSHASSPHAILELPPNAEPYEIKAAYRRLSSFFRIEHFESFGDPELLELARRARQTLKTAVRRLTPGAPKTDRAGTSSGMWEQAAAMNHQDDVAALVDMCLLDGLTYLRLGEVDEAWEHFQQGFARNPKHAVLMAYLGWTIYLRAGDDDNGRAAGRRAVAEAIRLDPLRDVPYVIMAHIYLREDQPSRAQQALHKALKLNPDNVEARNLIARIGVH